MSISIECRGCAMRYRIASHLAGERVKCKKCGEPIAVPGSEEDRPPIEIPLRPDSDAPVVRPKPPPLVAIRIPDPVPEFSTLPEITPPVLNAAAAFPFVPSPPPRQTIARPRDTDDRPRRRPTTAAPEGFSPMLLMIYVGVQIASAIYFSTRPNVAVSLVWTLYISEIVSFFAIVAPMAWLGIWGASRAMSYELAEPAYIKSAAVAVAPAMLLILIKTLPDNPVLILLCAAAILPATFLLIKLLFALTTLEAFVTYLLGAISCTIGRLIQIGLIAAILLGGTMGKNMANTGSSPAFASLFNAPPAAPSPPPAPVQPPSTPDPIYTPPALVDPVVMQLGQIEDQARAMLRPSWINDQSREQMIAQLEQLRSQAEGLRLQSTTPERKSKFEELAAVFTDAAAKAATLPTEAPDGSIYQPIVTSYETWRPASVSSTTAVSYQRYRLEIPTHAKVDLSTTEDSPDGVSWSVAPSGRFTIATAPRKDPRQERPWVKLHPYQKADSPDVFTLDLSNIPVDISYGLLGKMPATRIALHTQLDQPTRFGPGERWVKYVIADGKNWVVLSCAVGGSDARTLTALENTAWSVHQARGDEPRIDPFNAEALVGRLNEDRAVELVRQIGPAAEPALLARINDSDWNIRKNVIQLLGDIGTKKSVPPLLQLCHDSNPQLVELAEAAVKKLSPADMDDTTIALLDLDSGDFRRRGDAVAKLAQATPKPDDPRRVKVSAVLVDIVHDRKQSFGIDLGNLGDAIGVWQAPGTIPSLLPMLDHDADFMHRHTAMVVLAHTKDKRAVFPIVRWLIEDTRDAKEALIDMGPVAEDEVIKLLSNKNADARLAACEILGQIGTRKSLKPLDTLVYDQKAPGDADAGRTAIALIKDRVAVSGADTTRTPATPAAPGQNTDPGVGNNFWAPPTTSPPRLPAKQ
jgi:HEAT repeat protein